MSPHLARFHGRKSSETINRIPLLASEWAKGAFHYSGVPVHCGTWTPGALGLIGWAAAGVGSPAVFGVVAGGFWVLALVFGVPIRDDTGRAIGLHVPAPRAMRIPIPLVL